MPTEPVDQNSPTEPDVQRVWQRFLATGERDLQRLVLDIHDGPVQYLFAAISQLKMASSKLEPDSDAGQRVERSLQLLEHALGEIRHLVGAFRPPGFERRPVGDILDGLIVQHESLTDQAVEFELDPQLGDCALPVKIALYRIVQEALANGYRHGEADRQRVSLRREGPTLYLTVADDGKGFDAQRVLQAEQGVAVEGGHFGLRGIQDRVDVLGGTFSVRSTPGEGTELRIALPCQRR